MSQRRILYVEDNFQNKRLVKKILNSKGYEVLEAEDGFKGLEMAESERPDLILMDINLPGMDGMEATERLKTSHLKHIPVVALTANAMRGDRERIMAAGCDEYLQKPINKEKLVETIVRFLGPSDGTISAEHADADEKDEHEARESVAQPVSSSAQSTDEKSGTASRPVAKIPALPAANRPLLRPTATIPGKLVKPPTPNGNK